MLVAGSVIIGRREEGNKELGAAGTAGAEPAVVAAGDRGRAEGYSDEPDAPPPSVVGNRTVSSSDGKDSAYRDSFDEEIEMEPRRKGGEGGSSARQ